MNKKPYHIKSKELPKKDPEDPAKPVDSVLAAAATVPVAPVLQAVKPGKGRRVKIKPQDKPHYVNSKQFEDEIRTFYGTELITNYLAEAIRRIAYGLSFLPNFINYSYKDEMIGDAVVKMYQALKYKKFHLDKGFSPFSYFTTIAFHAFISRIKKEKKHHQLIVDYRERNYDALMNRDEESTGVRVYTEPGSDSGSMDNSLYNESNA
jgi:hypothetical protein